MPIYVDVIARLDERAAAASAKQVEKQFAQAGKNAGTAMEQAMNAELSRSGTAMNQMGSRLTQGFTGHGRAAGRGFGSSFSSELVSSLPGVSGFSSAMRGYEGAAGKAGAVAGRALGLAFTTAAAGIIGAAGYTLFKGFERYKSIDAAKNRLENLNRTLAQTGRATIDVGRVMDTVNQVVEGTPFSLDKAFSIATQALSSSTGDLNRFMTAVADTAAFLQADIGNVGDAFLQIASTGKVSMEQLTNQLRGLPLDWLAKELGVTGSELAKMMEKGEVGLETLMRAVEKNASGFAKGSVDTLAGSIEQMQTAVARLGANFLGALFGKPTDDANSLKDAINAVSDRLNDVNAWVTAHQADIRKAFEDGVKAVKDLGEALKAIGGFFDKIGIGVDDVVKAFVAWKSIQGITALTNSLTGVNTMLSTTLPASAAAGAAKMSSALGPVAALLASIHLATGGDESAYLTPGGDKSAVTRAQEGRWGELFMGDSWNWLKRQLGLDTGQIFGGGGEFGEAPKPPAMPPVPGQGLHWEDGKGWVPDAGPAGAPILAPPGSDGGGSGSGLPKAPQIPLPPEFGQPPMPGESVEAWKARMDLIEARHDVAEKEARVQQLEGDANATENDIINAKNDLIQSRMRTQELERKQITEQAKVQVPLPAELGQGPQPGESIESWRYRMDVITAQHDVAQKQAELVALEQSGTASQDELIQARHEFIEAQAKLNDVYTKNMEQTTTELGQIGAEIDKDFGISKGLAGIAENLTKFLANLTMAPVLGALTGVREGLGGTKGGGGIIGMAAATGAFGPQFMTPTNSTGYTPYGYASPAYSPSSIGPAQLQPGTNPNLTAMMALAQSSSGKVKYAPASDLVNGLADCSGSISDLVEVLQTGETTSGRLFTTTNFASDAEAAKLGFQPGYKPGALNVGVNPYPGMSGHMAATLPNGVNFEGGGGTGGGAQYGGNAAGALDPQFEKQYHLPVSGTPTSGTTASPYSTPGLYSSANTNPALSSPIPLPTSAPSGEGFAPGGAATGPTIIGGVGWPNGGTGGGGAGGGGGLLGGAAGMAAGAGGMALDAMAPGAGTAASIAANIAIQEINRAIQFGGELAGIGVQGLMETFLPVGASEMAANSWVTRIAGGIAGMAPQLPNIAGGKGGKGLTEQQQQAALQNAPGPLTPEQANRHGQGASPGPGNQTTNNITVNNQRATEDGTGRDIAWHQTNMHAGTMS